MSGRRVLLALLGAYVGLVGLVAHRHVTYVGGVPVPWGLVLTIGTTYAVARLAEQRVRVGAAWTGLGWAVVLVGQQLSPGGGYLVASDWIGWSFMVGCLGAIVLVAVRPPRVAA